MKRKTKLVRTDTSSFLDLTSAILYCSGVYKLVMGEFFW